jgi:hypothetical protein
LEDNQESISETLNDQKPKRWWWPYTHRTVLSFFAVLLVLKVLLGTSAAVGAASQGILEDWILMINGWNLTYDFGSSELTEGEGSLFWIISVNGYYDFDLKNIAKFPLYPAVTRTVWDLTGQTMSVPLILSLVHSLMVWAGLAEAYRFWEEYRSGYGQRALMWLLLSPLFILHLWLASYMEPGFVALLWLSLTFERNRKWAASSAALLCLTMLQPSGVILACFIGIRRLFHWYKGEIPSSAVAWAFLPGVAWSAWMLITSLWLDRFLAPYAFQEDWGRKIYRWPWDRWARYNVVAITEVGFRIGHFVTNLSLIWITLGFVWGGRLWMKLTGPQRHSLGGPWVLPLFTFVIVLIPFSSSVAGVRRYAVTTLIGIWPLLFNEAIQDQPRFRRFERIIWFLSLLICLLILLAFVTGYNYPWQLYF